MNTCFKNEELNIRKNRQGKMRYFTNYDEQVLLRYMQYKLSNQGVIKHDYR